MKTLLAVFGLDRELEYVDKEFYDIHEDWRDFKGTINNPMLADHIGMFFQDANMARCFGAYFEEDGCFQFLGFESIGQWDIGEGQGELHIVRITDDQRPKRTS